MLHLGYIIMADSTNRFHHMPTEERLSHDPHSKSMHKSTKYSSLFDYVAVLIFQNSFMPKLIQHKTFFIAVTQTDYVQMSKTDYYLGDA